jgi:twitching motility two-component system response regulator PilH
MENTRKHFLARLWGHGDPGEPDSGTNLRHVTVLVADDSRTITIALQRMLENDGYHTIAAFDGVEAVELAGRYRPDVILMDIVMPRMNGFEATRTILGNELTKHIPVIMISGNDQESDRIWGSRIGAKGFLAKPVARRELLATVQSTVLQARREAAIRERVDSALGITISPKETK